MYRCTFQGDIFIPNRQTAAPDVHTTLAQFITHGDRLTLSHGIVSVQVGLRDVTAALSGRVT